MHKIRRILNYYKVQISSIVQFCTKMDPQKTSIAIAAAICIGATPLFGLTFIIAVSFGFIFRLNQFILISVHILVSPLQIVLFYPFIRVGQLVFHLELKSMLPVLQIPQFILNHPGEFIKDYLKIMLAATSIWIIVSLFFGYFIYRIMFMYFSKIAVFNNRRMQDLNPLPRVQMCD